MDEYIFDLDAGKTFFDVAIRSKQSTYPNPVTPDQLRSLLGRFTGLSVVELTNGAAIGDIVTSNALYNCDISSGGITLDLGNSAIGTDNDIIVFKIMDVNVAPNTLKITDNNNLVTSLTGLYSFVVYKRDSGVWNFFYKADTASDMQSYFTELGVLKSNPEIHLTGGNSEQTNKSNIKILLKNIDYAFEDINVTSGNQDFYMDMVKSGNVDLILFCTSNIEKSDTLLDISLDNETTIIGGDFDTIKSIGLIEDLKPDEILTHWVPFKDESV